MLLSHPGIKEALFELAPATSITRKRKNRNRGTAAKNTYFAQTEWAQ